MYKASLTKAQKRKQSTIHDDITESFTEEVAVGFTMQDAKIFTWKILKEDILGGVNC